jgi:hypothetical protein
MSKNEKLKYVQPEALHLSVTKDRIAHGEWECTAYGSSPSVCYTGLAVGGGEN